MPPTEAALAACAKQEAAYAALMAKWSALKADSAQMIAILFATYGAVFVAEIVGDKLLYTTGVLATRYRTVSVMIGMLIAFMAKMAVAVAVGSAISKLPPLLVAALTSISFIGVAIALWRKPVERSSADKEPRTAQRRHWFRSLPFSFQNGATSARSPPRLWLLVSDRRCWSGSAR